MALLILSHQSRIVEPEEFGLDFFGFGKDFRGFGKDFREPHSYTISMTIINTKSLVVTEFEFGGTGKQQTRPATQDEVFSARSMLGKGIDVGKLEQERDSWRQKAVSALDVIREKEKKAEEANRKRIKLAEKMREAEKNSFNGSQANLLAAALDHYLLYLSSKNQLDSYAEGKELYRILTGEAWVNEDVDWQ